MKNSTGCRVDVENAEPATCEPARPDNGEQTKKEADARLQATAPALRGGGIQKAQPNSIHPFLETLRFPTHDPTVLGAAVGNLLNPRTRRRTPAGTRGFRFVPFLISSMSLQSQTS